MPRIYFNGIKNISSNGATISFVLDDTYETKSSGVKRDEVIEVITELEAAENIFKYLMDEISEIKSIQNQSNEPYGALTKAKPNGSEQLGKSRSKKIQKEERPPVGKKLQTLKTDLS